jgi:hypothetical protein
VQDVEPFTGHLPAQEPPLGNYAVLTGAFASGAAGFAAWNQHGARPGHPLRGRRPIGAGVGGCSREGARRAVGEPIVCPYCLGLWAAALLAAGFARGAAPMRWIASVLTGHLESDVLHMAYRKAENSM